MGLISCAQLLAFWRKPWGDLHLKASGFQALFDAFGHTPSGHLRADAAVSRDPFEGQWAPHLRVFERGEPIQIDRVEDAHQRFEGILHIGHDHAQVHPTAPQDQFVKPGQEAPIGLDELLGQRVKLGPVLHAQPHILGLDRVRLHTHVVKHLGGVGVF